MATHDFAMRASAPDIPDHADSLRMTLRLQWHWQQKTPMAAMFEPLPLTSLDRPAIDYDVYRDAVSLPGIGQSLRR